MKISSYIKEGLDARAGIDSKEIEDVAEILINALKSGNKLITFGNGGSAADAQHIAAELMGKCVRDRRALPAIALTTNTSTITSLVNDRYSSDDIFARQLEGIAKKGDFAIAISTSGNSRNIINGIIKAKEMGVYTVALTGRSGGRIKDIADRTIMVNSDKTPIIQEVHITVGHILSMLVEERMFDSSDKSVLLQANTIITRTPMRITFVGGGTDLPFYYRENGPGAVVNAAINRYMYIIVHKSFDNSIQVAYSKKEVVDKVEDLQHPVAREALKMLGIGRGIEIVSLSDVPSGGTGLGTSSAYAVGLLNALHAWKGEVVSQKQLAEEAVKIERAILKEPGGKQDQYIAAFGGIRLMEFNKDDTVASQPIMMNSSDLENFRKHLLLLYAGTERSSAAIQRKQTESFGSGNVASYSRMRDMAYALHKDLKQGRWAATGKLLDENWRLKRSLGEGITSTEIDALYKKARDAGAEGGKVIGAGGGGFLLFFAPPEKHAGIKQALGLRAEDFAFDFAGSSIICVLN
jgi:D-glycero-alpha-D-manno-heptose-7-phosphate kinase